MLISVDLPAPFSPSSACTSLRRRSKSMWSLASTPGNCFVIPRSSRTVASSTRRLNNRAGPKARSVRRNERARRPALFVETLCLVLPDRRRRLDLAGDDLRLQRVDLLQPGLRELGPLAELPEADAAVLQVEDEVAAADVPLAGLRSLDGEEDADVHPLHGAREDVAAEERLVDVDADTPAAALLRRVERTEAARPRDVEHDLRARLDLVLGDALALRLVEEVLRVADLDYCALHALLGAGLVTREKRVDRRDLDAADDADVLLARTRRNVRGETADQIAVLLRRVREALDVRDSTVERRALHVVVRDRELRVRELLRDVVRRIGQQEAGRDDDVVAAPCERGHVRQVVARRARLDRPVLDLQLLGRPLQPRQLVLVEALVVEATNVADQARLERGLGCRSAARNKAHGRENHGNKGGQPERQQSFLAQKTLLLLETLHRSEAMLLPCRLRFHLRRTIQPYG